MDVFSDVLRVSRLTSAVLGQARFVAPFGVKIDPLKVIVAHIILGGEAWLRRPGAEPLHLKDGDIIVLASRGEHVLSDRPSGPVRPFLDVMAEIADRPHPLDGAKVTHVLCASYSVDDIEAHRTVARLPDTIHLSDEVATRWPALSHLVSILRIEANAPSEGTVHVVPRLIDSLFVLAIRAWLDSRPDRAAGWYGALRSRGVGRALAALHAEPGRSWTLDSLASAAGQSRSTLARLFREQVGETPLAYLTHWRLSLAADRLRQDGITIEMAAEYAGFSSAPAFSRAFKRQFGLAPSDYRTKALTAAHQSAGADRKQISPFAAHAIPRGLKLG